MDYTLGEIVNHKNNIINLSNNLINTIDVNQEITINEELIRQSQFLLKLLNIKKNLIYGLNFQNNNINLPSSMPNQINMFNDLNNNQFQQMMPLNIMDNTQEIKKETINLRFHNSLGIERLISFSPDDKVSEVIQKYKNIDQSYGKKDLIFLFKGIKLNPNKSIKEEGLRENSIIVVYDVANLIGG